MISSHITVENPEKIRVTLHLTMEIKEWKKLQFVVAEVPGYETSKLVSAIGELVNRVDKNFWGDNIYTEKEKAQNELH